MGSKEWVIELIADVLKVQEEQVTLTGSLTNDLGADSLDIVEIMLAIEERYGFDIPDYQEEKLQTVSGLIEYVEQLSMSRVAA